MRRSPLCRRGEVGSGTGVSTMDTLYNGPLGPLALERIAAGKLNN